MPVLAVDEQSFEKEVLASEIPVLIDFHADWCQPCKQQSPIVEDVARELEGKLKVVKVDVDKSPRVAAAFRVQSIPQLFVVAGGQVAAHHDRGLADKATVLKLVEPFLPASPNELTPKDLAGLIKQRRVVPIDIRDAFSFGRYRIPGATHVAAEELVARSAELAPKDGRVRVLYGRTSDEARDAAAELGKSGVQVAWLAGGFLHWEADGFEIERGN